MNAITRSISLACLSLACAHAASAVPVSITGELWQFDHGIGLIADANTMSFGDATCLSCPNEWLYDEQLSNGVGTAAMSAFGRIDTYTASSDDTVSWSATGTLQALASVDATLHEGYSFAEAQVMRFDLFMTILEPVLFTGTGALFDRFAGLDVVNGSLLQPGDYLFSVTPLVRSLTVQAGTGQSVFGSVTQGVQYDFATAVPVPVPVPATGLLLVVALAGIGVVRLRANQSRA